ncbi:hypothetical protein HYC85_020590 [Camellia sinensis]|uniref:Uncharacterized protein n=1 Tax=Camellia sinensis TaxID=4442 RepID=A0A7J7GU33_CAMSI|nr:hypothetical protein HYC85_020590 [Camellia sinensis]
MDIPQLIIVRYKRNATKDSNKIEEKKPKNILEAFLNDDVDPASQLVARYNGSEESSELLSSSPIQSSLFSFSGLGLQWGLPEGSFHPGGLFASVGHVGNMGFGISPNSPNSRDNNGGFKVPYTDLYVKYVSSPEGFRIVGVPELIDEEGVGLNLKSRLQILH